ncbi:MAG: hypothetical protein KF689_00235 [Gemmatimonadaceae bacterium]|nr:hypothetical protein [Gemmatimonadaceae bacterium]
MLPTLAVAVTLTACGEPTTGASSRVADDYALVMFGEPGSALEGTMGEQPGGRPFDGRSIRPPFPDSLALTDEQRAEMLALRIEFREAHSEELAALRLIFMEARQARLSGASRQEVQQILAGGREIAQALRPDVEALHAALRAVLTDAQRAWLAANRPPRRFGPRP